MWDMSWRNIKNNIWFQGISCSLIASFIWWLKDFATISIINKILLFQIPIWLILIGIIACIFCYAVYKNKYHPKVPFIAFTQGMYQNQKWIWIWDYDKKQKKYHIKDLSIICPNCGHGILNIIYSDYKCGNCGISIPWKILQTSPSSVEAQIINDTRKKYPNFAFLIEKPEH